MGNNYQIDQYLLIRALKHNDQKLMQQLYENIFPKFRSHVLKNSGNEAEAKDTFQEAFVACWRNIKTDKFKQGNVEGYLFTIAKNKWTDHLRSATYKKTISADAEPYLRLVTEDKIDLDAQIREEQQHKTLQIALAQLGESCRQLLNLFYFERQSMEQIAKGLGVAPNSARNQKYRCMQKLRSLSLQNDRHGK